MASAGRVLIIPKGAWDANTEFEMLDLVTHNEKAWIARYTNTGEEPSEGSECWQSVVALPIANNLTTETEGFLLDATQGNVLRLKIAELNAAYIGMTNEILASRELVAENNILIENYQKTINTLTAKVEELETKLGEMPTITSGTTEPSGGEDGDIYIMHE